MIFIAETSSPSNRKKRSDEWHETLTTINDFVSSFIEQDLVSREDGNPPPGVCYLAQHPLIDQLPRLKVSEE